MKDFFSQVSADAWVQSIGTVIGAFLGALLAGAISLLIYRRDMRWKRRKEFRGFYRNYVAYYRRHIEGVLDLIGRIELDPPDFKRNELLIGALSETIDYVKGFYLKHVEKESPADLYADFEKLYHALIMVQTFSKYLKNEDEFFTFSQAFNITEIVANSADQVKRLVKLIDGKAKKYE
ncbi:hypothetical protein DUZ99_02100 [Xylanibacillus composti]|uniref:Uncharacterized protein n=1 Tax=Xylanibacillus composti TaxID=1572762 RepID=A0A8J4GYB6_9BACL|nr:hypothetical protein [Xylanibacillus composti]MDT9723787.1 hypothetical protein [Xylanibacillus composti]GIQ67442.1 hypothetical protein XYCOK13_02660 [Xylanibacillus composti]